MFVDLFDFDDAFAHGLQQTDIQKVMEQNRIELNQQLPNYSQISKIKIHFEEFEKNYLIDGKYYPTNPDYFGFTDMKGFYDKACELYTGFDYDNFTSFIPEYYAEVDGKLCVTSDRLGERGSDARLIDPLQAKLLLIYDGDNDDSIICIAANPVYDEVTFKEIIDYKFCAYRYVKTDDGLRCKVKSTIAKFGTEDSFNCSNLYEL